MNYETSHHQSLKQLIAARDARVAVVGLGYVGLPLALTAYDKGFDTTGVDLNPDRVARINQGDQVISYLEQDRIAQAVASGKFRATQNAAALAEADIILICVPTPLTDAQDPDMRFVSAAAQTIAQHLRPGQMVVLESSVWPGATTTLVQPILEAGGLRAGSDFFLAFSPEREDPGNDKFDTHSIPKVVGADDPQSRQLVEDFYRAIVTSAVPVSSAATAEAVKLVENSFRTVNIALVNELKTALEAMDVDVWEVIEAAATKPFGFMPFYPGPGIGGACIPVSPAYLAWRAADAGSDTPLINLARTSNDAVPEMLAARMAAELAARNGSALAETGQPLTGQRILLMGIAYKRDVEDTRRSPALVLLDELEKLGAEVDYHDPYFPRLPEGGEYPQLAGRTSQPLTADNLKRYAAVAVITDHSAPDYDLVAREAALVFDTRNVFEKQGIKVTDGRLVKM
ncbi:MULTISPECIES: nucleotide sugar dehydrogenase [unclassified Ruegeria]|uniref:nucleotide sugar dehydrogenase n=1 Tax=unclassified Ruegeria TaxID=2625375 RepID=UPI001492712A|nr:MULTISPECIES: nucleotide sugar dehydrogenase [unclassified Ruegeria]NOD49809.1 nucleotide sugar dehydrogenase [Ruegeria sp. HKCCD5849]NOD54089.1 nucleotide sugar dehydrogenase [Ruegeria sp. HKCCD5851]NOD70140.1 nucleotide sugar dehydrogenase [Ruegeria sp. HKCCD7303]